MRQASAQVLASQKQIENKYTRRRPRRCGPCTPVLHEQHSLELHICKASLDVCSVLCAARHKASSRSLLECRAKPGRHVRWQAAAIHPGACLQGGSTPALFACW